LANIRYIEDENLCARSKALGTFVVEALLELKKQHSGIGDIRGKGLMVGIELVRDDLKAPDAEQAERVRAICLQHGVLIGVGGVYGNVLRIQPPLVIEREQLGQALEIIGNAIRNESSRKSTALAR
jgi:4-aminobutyrate aminotransferase-like enzyme